MANFLFIRGNRNKKLFHDIGAQLEKRGHRSYLIKLELGELFMKSSITSIFAPFKITKEEYPITDEELMSLPIYNVTFTKNVLNKNVNKSELRTYKRYMFVIDKLIDAYKIDTICLFNGYHWIDQISKRLAEEKGLKVFYFEDGLFRPYTITCDPKGINARSSVSTDSRFYDQVSVNKKRLRKYLFKPEEKALLQAKRESLVKVALMKLASFIGALLHIHPKYYAHITFWQAVKYFIFKKLYRYKKEDEININEEYIFVPFQVSRDTQIFYHSPRIKTMEELLDKVVAAVKRYNEENKRNIKIIVKEHPEDMSRNSYKQLKQKYKDEVTFIKKYRMDKLLKHCLAVITINSTVGLEALAHHKKVITLGDALYNIDGIVERCHDPNRLFNSLQKVLASPLLTDKVARFLYYLRFEYQIEGILNSPNEHTARNIADRLSQYIELRGDLGESDWRDTSSIRFNPVSRKAAGFDKWKADD